MGKRRSGRELAFKLLFQIDVGHSNPDEVFAAARVSTEATSEVWVFASGLARGAWEKRFEIDPIIEKYASGWTLERMANADRNLLRLCLFEMRERTEIPASVSINEAVEMAKKYSTIDSAKFVNGILGSYSREVGAAPPRASSPQNGLENGLESEAEPEAAQTAPLEPLESLP